jgi:hypothetical protein
MAMDRTENQDAKDHFNKRKITIKVVQDMQSFENDPVFLKKREEAYEALKEVPLPEHIVKRLERD